MFCSNSSSLLANSARAAMLLVSHPPHLQEIAARFATELDITHKIWLDFEDVKHDKKTIISNEETILNAIYKDRYRNVEFVMEEEKQKVASSAVTSFISSVYTRSSNNNTVDRIDEKTKENVMNDCKLLFNEHYSLAMANLEQLHNEYSEKEASSSLKSILNTMKDSLTSRQTLIKSR